MIKIAIALYFSFWISLLTGCGARQTPDVPRVQKDVIGFEIRDATENQLVDDLDFDAPVTVERGPCRASPDCLIWKQGSDTFMRELEKDWTVTYRFVPTATVTR